MYGASGSGGKARSCSASVGLLGTGVGDRGPLEAAVRRRGRRSRRDRPATQPPFERRSGGRRAARPTPPGSRSSARGAPAAARGRPPLPARRRARRPRRPTALAVGIGQRARGRRARGWASRRRAGRRTPPCHARPAAARSPIWRASPTWRLGDDEVQDRPPDRGVGGDAEQLLGGGVPDRNPEVRVGDHDGCRSLANHIRRHDLLDDAHGPPCGVSLAVHASPRRGPCQRRR